RIQHYAAVVIDAMAAERRFKLRDARHHEAQLGILVGEFALQVEEAGAWNMAFLERALAGHCDIGDAAARRLVLKIGRAVEDAQVRLADETGEFLARNQPAALCHALLPRFSLRPLLGPCARQ